MSNPGELTDRYLDCELSEEEILNYGREQSKLLVEVTEFEGQRKLISDQIKPRKDRIGVLAIAIDTGIENRRVECVWEYDWDLGLKHVRRLDNDEIVGKSEPIGQNEEQPLPMSVTTGKKGK